jgi:hypothetical protein
MTATIETTTPTTNPLKPARARLISEFLSLVLPSYPNFPAPSDHEGVAQHIRDVANMFDRYLAAIGSEVRDNAVTAIDRHMFAGSFLGTVDGNETGVCEEQASALIEYAAERRASRRA